MSDHDLSRADLVELTKNGPRDKIDTLQQAAYDRTLADWRDDRPDDLDVLEAAHADGESPFRWGDIGMHFERRDPGRGDELVPVTGIEPIRGSTDERVRDLAWDFASDWIDTYRARLRNLQKRSLFSRQEFRTYWLQASLSKTDLKQMFNVEYPTLSGYETRAKEDGIDRAEATLKLVYDDDPYDDE